MRPTAGRTDGRVTADPADSVARGPRAGTDPATTRPPRTSCGVTAPRRIRARRPRHTRSARPPQPRHALAERPRQRDQRRDDHRRRDLGASRCAVATTSTIPCTAATTFAECRSGALPSTTAAPSSRRRRRTAWPADQHPRGDQSGRRGRSARGRGTRRARCRSARRAPRRSGCAARPARRRRRAAARPRPAATSVATGIARCPRAPVHHQRGDPADQDGTQRRDDSRRGRARRPGSRAARTTSAAASTRNVAAAHPARSPQPGEHGEQGEQSGRDDGGAAVARDRGAHEHRAGGASAYRHPRPSHHREEVVLDRTARLPGPRTRPGRPRRRRAPRARARRRRRGHPARPISRGTELLVFRGGVPRASTRVMRAPFQVGEFPGPVTYGYLAVGTVEEGPAELRGREVFCLIPTSRGSSSPRRRSRGAGRRAGDASRPRRHRRDRGERPWDAAPRVGDRIAVVGGGMVGCAVAGLLVGARGASPAGRRRPGARDGGRRARRRLRPPGRRGGRLRPGVHASATEAGLARGLELLGVEGEVIEMSWYGDRAPRVPLGEGSTPAPGDPGEPGRARAPVAAGTLDLRRPDGAQASARPYERSTKRKAMMQ